MIFCTSEVSFLASLSSLFKSENWSEHPVWNSNYIAQFPSSCPVLFLSLACACHIHLCLLHLHNPYQDSNSMRSESWFKTVSTVPETVFVHLSSSCFKCPWNSDVGEQKLLILPQTCFLSPFKCHCIILFSDWDSATLSNESLLDTVSRFVLAALLKHTNLLSQACGESRQVT